ncbi:MAG: glycosyltransferase [Wenzhouxiangella sp.]
MSSPDTVHSRAIGQAGFRPLVVAVPDGDNVIDRQWLERLSEHLPGAVVVPRGHGRTTGLEEIDADARSWASLASSLLEQAGADGALIIESGLICPPAFGKRLERLADSPDCPPLTLFAGNHDPLANPVAELACPADAAWVDSVAHTAGARRWTPVDHFSGRCLFVCGRHLTALDPATPPDQAWLYDGLFVHDPARALDDGRLDNPACRTGLGRLRQALERLIREDDTGRPWPLFGLDERPVTLHVSHDWGGGIARWISDVVAADTGSHHLVLSSSGRTDGRIHGQRLKLYAAGPGRGLAGEWVLTPAIAATETRHARYAEIVAEIIAHHGIGRIVVSSLIGHSLDALRTGLPTLEVLHDYYPAWPALDHDPLAYEQDGEVDLSAAIDACGKDFLFGQRDARRWRQLADAWQETVNGSGVSLIAPTRQVVERWKRLCANAAERVHIVPHGFEGWRGGIPRIESRPLVDGRLNLVVVGRLSPGKGLGLLERALPDLRRIAHITLVGCGHHGMRLFGQPGVDIVLDYDREALPGILATISPQAVLFLSTVAETWNYVLSETRALGLVPIASRTGSFVERIEHRRDGILFDPVPEDLVAALAALHEHPERLEELARRLPGEPAIAESVARWDSLVPARRSEAAPARAVDGLEADSGWQAAGLADARARISRQQDRVDALARDLAERTEWARRSERLMAERTRWAREVDAQLERTRQAFTRTRYELDQAVEQLREHEATIAERTRWAQSLDRELDRANRHIEHLDRQLAEIHASRSWRLTRPLRVFNRIVANARAHGWLNPLRWPRLASRLTHTLRVYGPRQTLTMLAQPRTGAQTEPLEPVTTSQPDERPEPVQVPHCDSPTASIVVPVFNKSAYTAACLHSIVAHSDPERVEIIVVDDCSSDDTPQYLAACEGLTVIRNETNSGFIHSVNTGAAAARGEFLVLLNNDTTVTAGWLDALLDTFSLIPGTGAVGARLVYPDGTLQEAGGIIFSDASGWNYGRGDRADRPRYNFASEADYVSGACLAIRRETFRELGGFDERYAPAYYEDTDLCFRLREVGLRVIYQPACTIVHHEGVSSGTDETRGIKRYQSVNRRKFKDGWAEQLQRQPAPVAGLGAVAEVERARHFRTRGEVLFIDAITPEPDKDSGSMRMQAMLEIFRDLGYRVRFMPENLARVDGYTRNLQKRGIEALYHPEVGSIHEWLAENGSRLDMVIVSRHYVLSPLLAGLGRHCGDAAIVFDTVDLHFLREQRKAELTGDRAAERMARRTREAELELIDRTDVTLVVSPVERELLTEIRPDADIRVLSNIHRIHGRTREWAERRDIMFVGGFQHPPNIDAAEWLIEEIFPLVRERIPEAKLHLIGSRMPDHLRERHAPGVIVHGFVEDLEPYLEGCRLSVAPLRYGAGVKGKVNQAMAWGLPVVATRCAAEGMYLEHGQDVLIADTGERIAEQIVRAYNDEKLWRKLSDGGLANVEKHFSYDAARRAITELLESL